MGEEAPQFDFRNFADYAAVEMQAVRCLFIDDDRDWDRGIHAVDELPLSQGRGSVIRRGSVKIRVRVSAQAWTT